MTDYEIKPPTADDLPALRAVLDATDLFPSDLLGEMIGPALDGTGGDAWLLCHGADGPVGFAMSGPEPMTDGTWNMRALAVHPAAQGTGAGRALIAHMEAVLAKQGARLLIVDTSGTNAFAQARAVYSRLGYTHAATLPEFWAAGDDKIVFCKRLR